MKTIITTLALGFLAALSVGGEPPRIDQDPEQTDQAKQDGDEVEPGRIAGQFATLWLRKYPMVIYLEEVRGKFKPPEEKPLLDQKNKMFLPHAMAVLKGTTIKYVNHDNTKHNVYFIQPDGEKLNLGTGTDDWSKDHVANQLGVYAHRCAIHEEMSAYIVSLQNPFFQVIQKTPKKVVEFALEGVPPGEYKLRVWCERYYQKKDHKFNQAFDVVVKSGATTEIEVKPKTK